MLNDNPKDKMQRRADILFPTMKDNRKEITEEKEKNKNEIGLGCFNIEKDDDEDITYSRKKNNEEKSEILSKKQKDFVMDNQIKESREDILYPTMNDKKEKNEKFDKQNLDIEQIETNKKDIGHVTGGAASLADYEISGVKKGEPMTIEDAINGVNPNYDIFGNPTYKTNCQAGVAIFEARLRGYDVEVDVPYGGDLKDKLAQRPNIAFIDPATGKTPEFTKIKAKNEFDCINYLENTVQKGERYIFEFQWKQQKRGHIITVTKDSNNNLIFYDPQNKHIYENAEILEKIKYQFEWSEEPNPPKILRVDDKEFNKEIFNQISKPRKSN